MSEQQTQETEPATYDVHATERKWREVWDRLDPFRADDDASPAASARSATR